MIEKQKVKIYASRFPDPNTAKGFYIYSLCKKLGLGNVLILNQYHGTRLDILPDFGFGDVA